MKQSIDLNVDLAEGFTYDEALLQIVSSANIACGLHAGNALEMRKAVCWAKENGVRIGAHPGYPDCENFGRKVLYLSEQELQASLIYQIGALQALCRVEQVSLSYVKPHGALYNQAAKDPQLAELICQVIVAVDPKLKLMGLAGSLMLTVAQRMGIDTISEAFADRNYLANGQLVPRTQENALIATDQGAIQQVLQLVQQGTITAENGAIINLSADSICLHGDNCHALAFAQQIQTALQQHQIAIHAT